MLLKDTMAIMGQVLRNWGRMPKKGKYSALYDEFQKVGGTTGYRDLYLNPEDRSKALHKELKALDRGQVSKAAHAVVDWLSDYNEAMENAVRLAAYQAAKDKGMSKERAASLAKNLTVNFNRKGARTSGIAAYYAFFNAALQGTTRMYQTLTGPAGKAIMAGGIALGVLNTVIGMAMMGADDEDDEDDWAKIPEFIKERSLIIPLGKSDYIAIPMPLGFHFLPNMGRLAAEAVLGPDEKRSPAQALKMAMIVAEAWNPLGSASDIPLLLAPTPIDPAISLLQNKDWTGQPIYRESFSTMNPEPGHTLARNTASPWSKAIAEALNTVSGGTDYVPGGWSPSPDAIDYVIGQITGGVGREISKLSQTVSAKATGEELPAHKIPLYGRLRGNTEGQAGQGGLFYENLKRANEMEREIKGRAENGGDVEGYLAKNPYAANIATTGNAYEARVRKLRTYRDKLIKSGADQSEVKEIDLMITDTMKQFNREMRAMQ
jgi:hypothetical protein